MDQLEDEEDDADPTIPGSLWNDTTNFEGNSKVVGIDQDYEL